MWRSGGGASGSGDGRCKGPEAEASPECWIQRPTRQGPEADTMAPALLPSEVGATGGFWVEMGDAPSGCLGEPGDLVPWPGIEPGPPALGESLSLGTS